MCRSETCRGAALPLCLAAALMALGAATSAAAQDVAASAVNPLAVHRLVDLKGMHERPLFARDRKPPPPPPKPQEDPEPADDSGDTPPDVALVGILKNGGDTLAVIRENRSGPTRTVRDGDEVGDWRISGIGSVSLDLKNGDRTVELKLFQTDAKGSSDDGDLEGPDPSSDSDPAD